MKADVLADLQGRRDHNVSFLERFKDATIGFSGYPRLARDKASGFGFMAFILFLALTVSCIITTVNMRRELAFAVDQLATAPNFGIRNGEVYFDGPMPYRIEEKDSKTLIIVDTTGKTTADALRGYSNGMLITRDKVHQVQSLGRVQTTDLKQLPFTFSKADVMGFMESLWILVPVAYIFVYLFQLGFKAINACVLGLVGMLYGNARGRQVPFQLGFKLGLYAMTLPIIIQWILPGFTTIPRSAMGWSGFLGWWGVSILYLIMGLEAHHRSSDDEAAGVYPE